MSGPLHEHPSAREVIIALRGDPPEACDFCDQPTLAKDLHPEEGDLWACISCIERWRAEEGEASGW